MIEGKDRRFSLSNYPLSWPGDWKRTEANRRKDGIFKRYGNRASVMDGLNRVLGELAMMSVRRDDVLVSTNIPTRLDGMPRSDQREPADSGVAVYWRKNQDAPMQCMAIDIYKKVADNLCAVAAVLEAMRAIERHGGVQVQERSFRGFAALPHSTSGKPWREVFDISPSQPAVHTAIEALYRQLARKLHPDVPGGSHEKMSVLNQARAEALKEADGQ